MPCNSCLWPFPNRQTIELEPKKNVPVNLRTSHFILDVIKSETNSWILLIEAKKREQRPIYSSGTSTEHSSRVSLHVQIDPRLYLVCPPDRMTNKSAAAVTRSVYISYDCVTVPVQIECLQPSDIVTISYLPAVWQSQERNLMFKIYVLKKCW